MFIIEEIIARAFFMMNKTTKPLYLELVLLLDLKKKNYFMSYVVSHIQELGLQIHIKEILNYMLFVLCQTILICLLSNVEIFQYQKLLQRFAQVIPDI